MKYRKKFNTKLDPDVEKEYQNFLGSASLDTGHDYSMNEGTYDLRGLFKEKAQSGLGAHQGHSTDKYKKPNHPTFSDESQYATKENPGGSWLLKNTFISPSTNEYGGQAQREYMHKYEPEIDLIQLKDKAKKRK